MKTNDELKKFYYYQLLPDLEALEKKRKSIINNVLICATVVLAVGMIVVFALQLALEPNSILFVLIVTIAITALASYWLTRDYIIQFKRSVIEKIIKFINPQLGYYPNRCISKNVFIRSKIFNTRPNRYKGDDYVEGMLDKTDFHFSELHAQYESGSGKNRSVKTVFKGLFFIADFNKHFYCRTIVLPDTAESLFGSFGKLLQSWNIQRDQLIKLDDPEFEKILRRIFKRPSTGKVHIIAFVNGKNPGISKKSNRRIFLSFTDSSVFVAIPYIRNLFEPRILRTIVDFKQIQEYFDDLNLAIGIVEDLNLNTRIWTKE